MAKEGAPGRDIYDEIYESAPNGKCPLCAHRPVSSLDHYLPKAHYPALVVTPLNLVPSCGDCNKSKLNAIPLGADEVGFHPYYDNVDGEKWLYAKVVTSTPAAVVFIVQASAAWDNILTERVRNHFRDMGLGALYASEAADELSNIRHQFVGFHNAGGMQRVRHELEERAESCAEAQRNGWRTATYQAWAESDWFCDGGFSLR